MKLKTVTQHTNGLIKRSLALCLVLGPSICSGAQALSETGWSEPVYTSPPRVLNGGALTTLGVPPIAVSGEPICDGAGDLFFDVSSGPLVNVGPFLGIKADGSSHAVFTLPSELTSGRSSPGITLQAVSPDGDYYLLNTDFKTVNLISYKNDGTVISVRPLTLPARAVPASFAVANSGVIYLQGYISNEDPRDKPRKSFAEVLDASGKMIRALSEQTPEVSLATLSKHPLESAATAGDDGRFYVLGPNEVRVLSQSGELVKELPFKKPDPGAAALRIDASGGLVSIAMYVDESTPKKHKPLILRLLVLDTQTGEQRGDYVLNPELRNSVLCFNAKEGYVVSAFQDGQQAKQVVPLR